MSRTTRNRLAPLFLLYRSVVYETELVMSQQVPIPQTAAEVTAPATGIVMHPEYARAVARMAYIWGWPLVNQMNGKAAITQAPQPGLMNGVLPIASRGQVAMLSNTSMPDRHWRERNRLITLKSV
jgi:hypothetical protein